MASNGISGREVDESLPYASITNTVCDNEQFFPAVAYAIFWQESIQGQVNGKWNAATVESDDGGHGIGQLTSSWPSDWQDPTANITYAVEHYLLPALDYWKSSLQGDDLVRAIAATYNAGLGAALAGHAQGNIDLYTTDDYAARALASYTAIVLTGKPAGA